MLQIAFLWAELDGGDLIIMRCFPASENIISKDVLF